MAPAIPRPKAPGWPNACPPDLATQGLLIISGMAHGVDPASHRGAIWAKGRTGAVFETGIDVIYPIENSRLSEQILALGGALVFEFPQGTFAAPSQNFPIRNRILSGHVDRRADRRGRAILRHAHHRLPGTEPADQPGAKLVATWEDAWEDLPTEV